jgi:hypothetical protein
VRISGSLVLLVTAALTVACSSGKSGDAQQKSGGTSSPAQEINKTLTLNQRTGTAAVTLISLIESYKPNNDIAKSQSGNFVAMTFKFDVKTGEYAVNPLYIHYKKSDGKIVGSDEGDGSYAVPAEQEFKVGDGDVTEGKSVTGMVVFDTAYDKGGSILVTDTMSLIAGEWPLSGGEPRVGDGSPKRELNKSITHKQRDASAAVTLVSVTESKGGLEKKSQPESGTFVVVELKFDGKSGEYSVNPLYVKLKKPDGSLVDMNQGNGDYGAPIQEILDSDDLAVGKTMTGKMAFDIAPQPGMKLVLTDTSDKVTGELPMS